MPDPDSPHHKRSFVVQQAFVRIVRRLFCGACKFWPLGAQQAHDLSDLWGRHGTSLASPTARRRFLRALALNDSPRKDL